MISHPALQRGSSPTLKPVPASLALEFQEARNATLVPNFWDVKKLLLNRAVAVQKTHGFRKMGMREPREFTVPAPSQNLPRPEMLLVFRRQQLFVFLASSQGGGAVPLPWSKVMGGQGGGERERRCLTHHLFFEQCSRGFLINRTPRCRK